MSLHRKDWEDGYRKAFEEFIEMLLNRANAYYSMSRLDDGKHAETMLIAARTLTLVAADLQVKHGAK